MISLIFERMPRGSALPLHHPQLLPLPSLLFRLHAAMQIAFDRLWRFEEEDDGRKLEMPKRPSRRSSDFFDVANG